MSDCKSSGARHLHALSLKTVKNVGSTDASLHQIFSVTVPLDTSIATWLGQMEQNLRHVLDWLPHYQSMLASAFTRDNATSRGEIKMIMLLTHRSDLRETIK